MEMTAGFRLTFWLRGLLREPSGFQGRSPSKIPRHVQCLPVDMGKGCVTS